MEFSTRILNLRKENNYTQEEVAEKLEVTRQTISNWETGSAQPTIDKVVELSHLYNISLDDLVGKEIVKDQKQSTILSKLVGQKITIHFSHESDMAFKPVLKHAYFSEVNETGIKVITNEKNKKYERVYFQKDIVAIEVED